MTGRFWQLVGMLGIFLILAVVGVVSHEISIFESSPSPVQIPVLGDLVLAPALKHGVSAGTQITITDIDTRLVPITEVYSQTVLSLDGVVGKLATENLQPHKPIQQSQLDQPVEAPVLKHSVPIGTQITITHIYTRLVPGTKVYSQTVLSRDGVVGKLATENLQPHKPIQQSQLDQPVRIVVPSTFVTAGVQISPTLHLTYTVIGARRVTTDTLITLTDIVPDDQVATTAVHLLEGQILVKDMVSYEPQAEPEPSARYTAKKDLEAGDVLEANDRECVPIPSEEKEAEEEAGDLPLEEEDLCAGLTDPADHMLLVDIAEGEPIQESDVTPKHERVVEIQASMVPSGTKKGDFVDIYAAAHVFTDTEGAPVILDASIPDDSFEVRNAWVEEIEDIDGAYRLTLGMTDEDAKMTAQVEPFVDFFVVRQAR